MSAQLMDGKALAAQKKAAIRAEVERLARTPGLAVVLVGENPASQIYVRGKARDCEECGIRCMDFRLPAQTTESELLTLIAELNGRADVDGILVHVKLLRDIIVTFVERRTGKGADGVLREKEKQLSEERAARLDLEKQVQKQESNTARRRTELHYFFFVMNIIS